MYASAQNVTSGKPVNSLRSTSLVPLASVTKVPTAVAAVKTLGTAFRFKTNVYTTPGKKSTITVLGGGDPTLSSTGKTVYTGAATVTALAKQVKHWAQAKKIQVTSIVINHRLFRTAYSSDYTSSDRKYGYVSRVAAFQVDGDRKYPTRDYSKRLSNSVTHAGSVFRSALARQLRVKSTKLKLTYSSKDLSQKYTRIATVQSQPLPVLLKQMLRPSDNTLANALAFQVAMATHQARTFAGIQPAYEKTFKSIGVPLPKGTKFRDGSGLSERGRLQPAWVTHVLRKIVNDPATYKVVRDALPVAGKSGTLHSRFTSAYARQARGRVQAKTGYISSTTSLAGITKDKQGATIVFTSAIRKSKYRWSTRAAALDNLASAYYHCGGAK